jgi:hypothetical protein
VDTSGIFGLDNAEAITGAQVIIAEDMGLTDTLRPLHHVDPTDPGYEPAFTAERGYYETTKITGIPGHSYQLRVRIGNEEFQASAYMPPTVPVIDSVLIKKDLIADPTGLMGDAAFAYFKEPGDEANYYMLQLNASHDSAYDHTHVLNYGPTSTFPFYVFDDRTLPAYVQGMEVITILSDDFGHSRFQPYWITGDPIQVRLSSLTRQTYEYFNALEQQFLNDGNVYKPAPASAAGNISGGALGLFWAANISGKVVLH